MMRTVWLLLLLVGACLSSHASPDEEWRRSPKPIREAVRATVEGQLDALRTNNWTRAYDYTSVGIRTRFTLAVFAAMMKRGYPALIKHTQAEVGAVRDNGSHHAQTNVTVNDRLNRRITFRYFLVEEEAGWRIDGVVAEAAPPRDEI